jgi:hypothetical protein
MFPRGWPGIALALLRLSVAAACLQTSTHRAGSAWVLLADIPLCASLCAGALTPLAAVLAVALQLSAAADLLVSSAGCVVITILDAAALALLGPGAYSLDALRFGRRVISAESHRDLRSE